MTGELNISEWGYTLLWEKVYLLKSRVFRCLRIIVTESIEINKGKIAKDDNSGTVVVGLGDLQ
jgi:hypothetical protein